WECCPREFVRRAIAALSTASGLMLVCAFEQEFVYTGIEDRPGHPYSVSAFRRQGPFGESLVAALRAAGLGPDSFLTEYGPRQFEFTVAPETALKAADQAVIARELARSVAFRLGHRAIFSPMPYADGTGNGVHIHFSLHGPDGEPKTYDPSGPLGLSEVAAHFAAGVLAHLPAIAAITAPSPVSYLRLTPNRWAQTVAAPSGRAKRASAAIARSGARQHGEKRDGGELVRAGVPRGLSPPQAFRGRACQGARRQGAL